MKMDRTQPLTFTCNLHRQRQEHGRLVLRSGAKSAAVATPVGRVARISRLMALALRFEDLLRRGEVRDYAELARLGHVTRARVTQIMNLLLLAPDIQEKILFLPLVESGHDPVKEWQVRPIAAIGRWQTQIRMWTILNSTAVPV